MKSAVVRFMIVDTIFALGLHLSLCAVAFGGPIKTTETDALGNPISIVLKAPDATKAAKKTEEKPKRIFPPAVEKALKTFADGVAEVRRKHLAEEMSKSVADVVKTVGADEAANKKLEAGAKTAIEQSTTDYPEKLIEWLGKMMESSEEETLEQINQWPEEDAARWSVPGTIAPEDQPVWAETIKAALSTVQFATWEKLAAEKKHGQDEEIVRYLRPMTERMKEQFKAAMDTEMSDLTTAVALEGDRLEKLKVAASEASTKSTDAWREMSMKTIRAMAEQERRQLFSRDGSFYSGIPKKPQGPDQQPVWKDALKALLSEDESERLKTAHNERSSRRQQAFALLLTSELDKRIGFTVSQRERILPLAIKPARNLIKVNTDEDDDDESSIEGLSNWNLQQQNFSVAALKMPEPDVRAILDDVQWKRWEDYCKNKTGGIGQRRIAVQREIKDGDDADMDARINEHMHKIAVEQEQHLFKSMLVRVEDATRIAALKPDAVDQLTLAARGAVERTMDTWRSALEEYVRNNLNGARAGDLRERIANMGNLGENVNRDKNPQEQPLWLDAIKAVLTTEQNETWQKELEARSAYRERATAALALSELDRRRRLTSEQVSRLEPIVVQIVKDYAPDITRYLSNDWQLRSYYLLVPLTGIAEADMKSILTPAQWKLVQERDLAQIHSYWEGIKNYHDQRVKEKK